MRLQLSLSLLALICTSGLASAQDNWTGWYVGANAGHANGDSSATGTLSGQWSVEPQALRDEVTTGLSRDLDPSGSAYGVQFGYNHQFANGFMLGGEIDYGKANIDDAHATGLTPTAAYPSLSYDFTHSVSADEQIVLRGRFGYAVNRHLFYASAGWTQVDAEASAGMTSNGGYKKLGTHSETLDGTQFGAGYEYDFGNKWSLRMEYLRTDVGDFDFATDYLSGSTFTSPAYNEAVKRDLDFDTFSIGVNYRF